MVNKCGRFCFSNHFVGLYFIILIILISLINVVDRSKYDIMFAYKKQHVRCSSRQISKEFFFSHSVVPNIIQVAPIFRWLLKSRYGYILSLQGFLLSVLKKTAVVPRNSAQKGWNQSHRLLCIVSYSYMSCKDFKNVASFRTWLCFTASKVISFGGMSQEQNNGRKCFYYISGLGKLARASIIKECAFCILLEILRQHDGFHFWWWKRFKTREVQRLISCCMALRI